MTSRAVRIVGGPGKWDMILSEYEDKSVTFVTEDGEELAFKVEGSLEHSHWDSVAFTEEVEGPGDMGPEERLIVGEVTVYNELLVVYGVYSLITRNGYFRLYKAEDADQHQVLRHEWARRIAGKVPTTHD